MRSIGIAALVLLGLFLGVFLWLEFTTDVSREFMLSDGDTAESGPVKGAESQKSGETGQKTPPNSPVTPEKLSSAAENTPEPEEKAANSKDRPGEAVPRSGDAAAKSAPKSAGDGASGPLPRIGADGSKPWRKFATKTGNIKDFPKIAVIVTNLGLGQAVTDAAIDRLPAFTTLAFSPYGRDLSGSTSRAREVGHEILVLAPMEPVEYPNRDPGDKALLIDLNAAENIARLKWIMGRFTGYVGIMGHMGSRFTGSARAIRPILLELDARGLIYVDNATAPKSAAVTVADEIGLPNSVVSIRVDTELSAGAIDARLAEAEAIAKRNGSAVVLGFPYPVTIDRIAAWITELAEREIAAVPLTVLIEAKER